MAKITNEQYIIAIGASSGGLEAISVFFDHTPLDSVSYVVVQHLSPDFKSQMVKILSRHTELEVIEATHNTPVLSNKVYLIPSTDFMGIEGGELVLHDKIDQPRPHMTIDYFFNSLAMERGDKAIGIILSGTGRDGAAGIEAVKNAGGMVIVQDPATAGFNEMPFSALNTGCADLVLSPEAMPQVIENYVTHGTVRLVEDGDDGIADISRTELDAVILLIKERLPLDFTDYKRPTIIRRIKRRMIQHQFSMIGEYLNFLKGSAKEMELLAQDFLISVTSFFRDPDAFDLLENEVIPEIVARNIGDVLKIWVAGCATGEEAYSIAMLIQEHLLRIGKHIDVKIFATDINKAALDIASKAVYKSAIEKMVSPERLAKFFTKEGYGYKVSPDIRKMLIFAQHDLVKNPPYCNIDLISCRNLLIYMNTTLQTKVLSMMHFGLKKNGYLFLGPSENAAILETEFKAISNKWNIFECNKSGRTASFNSVLSPVIDLVKSSTISGIKDLPASVSKLAVATELNRAILEESGYSGVCVNAELTVVQSFGNPARFLKNELFNFNLNALLPDPVLVVFKAAAHKALKTNKRIVINSLYYEMTDGHGKVDIVLKPFLAEHGTASQLLILFIEHGKVEVEKNVIRLADVNELTKEHLISLEAELTLARHNLIVADDRIASSNENIQSFNEELLSANEEMQSANEELQSLNEELQTINKEQQVTNAELSESNNDLNNYFRSNVNGQLFVDRELLLKKYSPSAVKHINIRPSDIGRPLSNITTNIDLATLIPDIRSVLETEQTVVREAISTDGKIYQVTTIPYLRADSKIADGAIVSFYDISELKNSMKYAEEMFNTIHDPLVILDKNLRVIRATDGFYRMFKVTEEETQGNFFYELGNQQWNIPVLKHQLETILPEQGSFKAFEVSHIFNSIGAKVVRITARQFDTHTREKLILLAIHDLSDARKVEAGLAEAERLLEESKERLHFAIESAGIGTWDYNPDTRELIFDHRSRELFGLLTEGTIDYGMLIAAVHPDDVTYADQTINDTLNGDLNGDFNLEFRTAGKDKKIRWIKSKGKAYFNEAKIATRFIGTVLDISMEKASEETTKGLLLKKDEFISIASHELKTPVTSLKASLQLLSRMQDKDVTKATRLIDQSTKSMEKITSLIDDLLNVTRMNEGQLRLDKTPFIIADVLDSCCGHVRSAGIYELIVQGDFDLKMYADEHQIEQVVVNLVNNAVKYAPDYKKIFLIIEKEGSSAKISVKDGGPGIPEDQRMHLFEKYYRADHSGTLYSGLGLGLYISSEIVKRHGGMIGVDSIMGSGSTFWFTIPLTHQLTAS